MISTIPCQDAMLRPPTKVTISGPLCFSGDNIAMNIDFPTPEMGDFIVVHDAGANTISLFSRHCSRQAPPVYGFEVIDSTAFSIVCLKQEESEESVLNFWK